MFIKPKIYAMQQIGLWQIRLIKTNPTGLSKQDEGSCAKEKKKKTCINMVEVEMSSYSLNR